jgi:glutathione S-transferase
VFQGIGSFEIAFDKMEKDLTPHGSWLVGPEMTLADVNMMPFVARLAYLDLLDIWIAERPATQDWWRRVQVLLAAITDKTTAEDVAFMKTFGSRIRTRVSERREEYLAQLKAAA